MASVSFLALAAFSFSALAAFSSACDRGWGRFRLASRGPCSGRVA